tara:strand:+ start:111 stop:374 length:264 start_codon:yes stop_codon:yes gene_type:complete
MNNFKKRHFAIRNLYPEATSCIGDKALDKDGNEITVDETAIANKITEMDAARDADAQAKADLKASAKSKLISGEKLTEEEANVLVGV